MKKNKIEIKLIKVNRNPKEKYVNINYYFQLLIINNDTFLTEKIIEKNIQFQNLKYKTKIIQLSEFSKIIKANFLQEHYPNEQELIYYKDYSPKEIYLDLKELNRDYLYKIETSLIEKIPNTQLENEFYKSSQILFFPKKGLITEKIINQLYKERYKPKRLFSKSEKDNINNLNSKMKMEGLDTFLDEKTIKNFTYEGRTYDNIHQFVDSKYKTSKLMTDLRKKKFFFLLKLHFFLMKKLNILKMKIIILFYKMNGLWDLFILMIIIIINIKVISFII